MSTERRVEFMRVDDLVPALRNPRTRTPESPPPRES